MLILTSAFNRIVPTKMRLMCMVYTVLSAFVTLAAENKRTFDLKRDATSTEFKGVTYNDLTSYLYTCKPVRKNSGKVLIRTDPRPGRVIAPAFGNGFIGAIYQAYNEHRHLVLRPDDVWLAITTAFGLYVNNHAEEMRSAFVEHEGKIELVATGNGDLYTVDWAMMIEQMSEQIEKNTKGDVREWIEPSFSTTTPVTRTVGQVILMGVMKHYFDYKMILLCGLPKVTLEGTLEDWKELRRKASVLKSFQVDCLTHWADLLDPILAQFEQSYQGDVDEDFWSRICHSDGWQSGPTYLGGWVNVFIPFSKDNGSYTLFHANPQAHNWGRVDMDEVPPSTTKVPVLIDDNGVEYSTFFYGGHLVSVYNEEEDSLAPSLDWAIIDVTDFLETKMIGKDTCVNELDELMRLHMRRRKPGHKTSPKPAVYNV